MCILLFSHILTPIFIPIYLWDIYSRYIGPPPRFRNRVTTLSYIAAIRESPRNWFFASKFFFLFYSHPKRYPHPKSTAELNTGLRPRDACNPCRYHVGAIPAARSSVIVASRHIYIIVTGFTSHIIYMYIGIPTLRRRR